MTEDEMLKNTQDEVVDETESENVTAPVVYNITSYGADYDVAGLVKRLQKKDIIIPSFQRAYVWKQEHASHFIESLLLGLPVPGIFLATERETNKFLVIDGQQRLKSLQFFYEGYFNPSLDTDKKTVFKLIDVQKKYDGQTYELLSDKDRRRLDDSILHATIIKQDSPTDGDTSVYHIFERLNASGVILKPQEIRRAAFHGPFLDKISELNNYQPWRTIFGQKNKRLKDEELILRFLALYYNGGNYEKPMEEFLNKFASVNQYAKQNFLTEIDQTFRTTIDCIAGTLIIRPFRVIKGINAAVFDSVMVGLTRRLKKNKTADSLKLAAAYNELMRNSEYEKSVTDGTSNIGAVTKRIELATQAFDNV